MAKEEDADGLDVWDVALLLGGGALGAVGGRKLARTFMSKKFLERAKAAKASYKKTPEREDIVTNSFEIGGGGVRNPPTKIVEVTKPDYAARKRNRQLEQDAAPYKEYLDRVFPVAASGAFLGGGGAFAARHSSKKKRK